MVEVNSAPDLPDDLYVHLAEVTVSWEAYTPTSPTTGRLTRAGQGSIRRLRLNARGRAGLAGEVLPRGRLPSLMKQVVTSQQMEWLCWGVLARYSQHYGQSPKASPAVRRLAFRTIERAWQAAGGREESKIPAGRLLERRCTVAG